MIKKGNKQQLAVVLSMVLSLVVGGCKKEETPQPPPAPQKPAVPAKPPVQRQTSSARTIGAAGQLDFSNKKDPFKPFIQAKVEKPAASRGTAVGLLPIQNYDVEQFKVSGIIVGLKQNQALVIDPAGKGYVIKQGMTIGRNDGVVTKITPGYIEVFEKFRDDLGKIRKKTIKLSLPKKN